MKKIILLVTIFLMALAGHSQVTAILNGSASYDPDGTITTYHWRQISGTVVALQKPDSVKCPVTFSIAGTYLFGLVVTDNQGAVSAEDTVKITINPANIRPHADAGPDQTLQLPTTGFIYNKNSDWAETRSYRALLRYS